MMKRSVLFILSIVLFSASGYSGNDEWSQAGNTADTEINGQDTATLPSCGLKTAFISELVTKAVILKKEPEGKFSSLYIIPAADGGMQLIEKMGRIRVTRNICNYPRYALDWDVPEEGLPVIFSGNVYHYDRSQTEACPLCFQLELLTIKKADDPASGGQNVFQRTGQLAGNWQVKSVNLSEAQENIISPSGQILYPDISIQIPNTIESSVPVNGHTFYNKIWVDWKLNGNQISFKNYRGTRLAEDKWGHAFRDNLWHTVKFKIIDHNELIFLDAQDKPTIIFTRK